ncbi:MAG: hypothetical protein ACHP7N_00060 [Caulobacterales bacterium]
MALRSPAELAPNVPTVLLAVKIRQTFVNAEREIPDEILLVTAAGYIASWPSLEAAVAVLGGFGEGPPAAVTAVVRAYRAALEEAGRPDLIAARMRAEAGRLGRLVAFHANLAAEYAAKASARQQRGEAALDEFGHMAAAHRALAAQRRASAATLNARAEAIFGNAAAPSNSAPPPAIGLTH